MSKVRLPDRDREYGRVQAFDVGSGIQWRKKGKIEGFSPWGEVPATLADIRKLRAELLSLISTKADEPDVLFSDPEFMDDHW